MPEFRHQIEINAKPDKVYAALTSDAGLRSWWTADSKTDGKVGGKAEFGFGKRSIVFRMKIKSVVWRCHGDQPEWIGTELTWSLTKDGERTIVRFKQAGWKAATDMFAICNSSWGELMHRLKDYVEGKNPGPHWKE